MTGYVADRSPGTDATPPADASSGNPSHEHLGDTGELRSVDDVRAGILDSIETLAPIELHLQEAFGCVLAKDVVAELDIPSFSSSAMDGFAVRASDVDMATVDEPAALRIVGRVLVGQTPEATVGGGEAVRIATGAPVPAGADAI